MKKFITGLFLLMGLHGWGQVDTVFLSREKLADTLYHKIATKAPTGYLANKLSLLPTDSLLLKTENYPSDSSNRYVDADKMMQWLYEMNHIAVGDNKLPHMDSIFEKSYSYVGEMDFEQEIIVIPVGIFELKYNLMDEQKGVANGILGKEGSIWVDLNPGNNSIVSTHTSSLAGPLFDYFSSEVMGLVVKSDFFISNTRKIGDVKSLELGLDGTWKTVKFDEISYFAPHYDSVQSFKIRITYSDGTSKRFDFILNTPEVVMEPQTKSFFTPEEWEGDDDDYATGCKQSDKRNAGCTRCGTVEENGNKLKWCMIPACGRDRAEKPYVLVTGYRPPLFGQSFKKTWKIYNTDHASLLQNLGGQDYDIFLVKFNIHARPQQHGMEESAALFERFLVYLNQNMKTGDYFENIIQGSSMGEEIAQLALLRMEKKHMDYSQNYPHHHSRLNISYDANFYGANIPLGYQYQVYSAHYYKTNYFGAVNFFLSSFLYATVNQKTFKELVAYHAASYNDNIFTWPVQTINYTPTHHWRRQGFLNALAAADNGEHIFPMPVAARNIAISLGKIDGKNSDNDETFNNAGEYWQNISILGYRFRIGTAKYMPAGQTFQIFRRQVPAVFFNPFQSSVKHEVNVSQMQEIDNVSGSFMRGVGNFISVADWTYFPITQIWNGKAFYTHKPVASALGINKNLWPNDGSMTVNVHDLKLMYNQFGTGNPQSDYYGYPNIGRPDDHFKVTPFEAIYIDTKIDSHIDMSGGGNYVDNLNDFIYGEAEPWYLGLQNQKVGSRARENFQYYVRRRARNVITVGHLVTPATDPGDYVVQKNAIVDLRAGDAVIMKPGVHFMPGSTVHIKIEFEHCGSSRKESVSDNTDDTNTLEDEDPAEWKTAPDGELKIFPNPTTDRFTVVFPQASGQYSIGDVNGRILEHGQVREENRTHALRLPKGVYYLTWFNNGGMVTKKIIVL